MSSGWFLLIMAIQFSVMALVALFVDKSWPWFFYGVGAAILNLSLLSLRGSL